MGSSKFSHCFAAQQDQLLTDVNAAAVTYQGAVRQGTQADQAHAWQQWQFWGQSVGISNSPFLRGNTTANKRQLRGAFSMTVHNGWFSGDIQHPLAESTVRNTVTNVAQTFWDHGK